MACDIDKIAACFDRLKGKIFFGIDGFVDEVWQVVETRQDRDNRVLFKEMKRFAQAVLDCGKGGISLEIVKKRRSYGGFTANTGHAAGQLGGNPVMVGLFGQNGIDPAFQAFTEKYQVFSVGNPGICPIYEFDDGKIMLPYIEETMDLSWERLSSVLEANALKGILADCSIIALGYWSLTPAFDELARGLCETSANGKPKRMFFDFADIRKKDSASLRKTLGLLAELNILLPMSLSLNEHEASMLFAFYGEALAIGGKGADLGIEKIREKAGLDELIVHTPHWAAAASKTEGCAIVEQDYCENPVITAGAGDNFNAGYLVSFLGSLDLRERLAVANATTHFYLSHGRSPDKAGLINELRLTAKKD
ncbi:MAG: carbohydrate kinase family protein [Clostridiales bacterium]|jgi:sugar/nucleoside kinase (ribokinase family)|nr:carbohydrate kinase family protein [Clostridiales bacterium]